MGQVEGVAEGDFDKNCGVLEIIGVHLPFQHQKRRLIYRQAWAASLKAVLQDKDFVGQPSKKGAVQTGRSRPIQSPPTHHLYAEEVQDPKGPLHLHSSIEKLGDCVHEPIPFFPM